MSEWVVDIQSMIPVGELGERMVVARVDRLANKADVMCNPTMKSIDLSAAIGVGDAFMVTHGMESNFLANEIDHFLQAMMDAGWKRGLRPSTFTILVRSARPSISFAIRAMVDESKLVEDATGDSGVDKDMKW